jgi:lipopolysaccharide/colanic/teichoic acid biosynthesis glycosyltransferase
LRNEPADTYIPRMEAIPLASQAPLQTIGPVVGAPAPKTTFAPSRLGHPPRKPARIYPLRAQWYLPIKYACDRVFALVGLIALSPVIALTALLVKATSRGPAFYSQTRLGLNGAPFTIYKVRTMVDNCESLTGPRWSIPGDPRITPLGWFLRVTHLDELPQLVNVLRGEMSLIGPRPERPEFLPELEESHPAYRQRLHVRPGISGLAQTQLPADTDVEKVRHKLALDLYYIRHLTPLLDLKLLLATALHALGIPGRVLRRIVRIPDSQSMERTMEPLMGEGRRRVKRAA